jgi:peroxiredoxin
MEEVPLLKALHTKYAKQAAIIGISIDTGVTRVDRTMKQKGMTWPILADGKGFDGPIPKAYHIQGTPELFIVDRDGKIFARLGSAKLIEASLSEARRESSDRSTEKTRR